MQPPLDAAIWVRILAAAVLVFVGPGLLAVRPWWRRGDPLAALSLAVPAGILLVAVVCYGLVPVGPALRWWLVLPLAAALALVVFRAPRSRESAAPSPWWPAAVACGLMAGVVVAGLAGYDAPRGDAANHAFMVRRLAEVRTVAQDDVFAAPVGGPGFVYLMGWHAGAALVAQLSAVAPYLVAWVLPLLCLALLPVALIGLWRRCGVPAPAAVWGAVLVAANRSFPAGAMQWGALGHAVGWLCVPVTTLAVLAALSDGGWRRGLLAGLLLVGLLLVHAVELPVVVVMTLCGWLAHRHAQPQARPDATGGLLALGLLIAAGAAVLAATGLGYGAPAHAAVAHPWREFGRAIDSANRAGWQWAPTRALVLAGIWLAWRRRVLRPLAVASVAAAVLYVTLSSFRDPLSKRARRTLLPRARAGADAADVPAGAAAGRGRAVVARVDGTTSARLARRGLGGGRRRGGAGTGGQRPARPRQRHEEPWGAAPYALARALTGVVRDGEVVANLPQDGSVWASHAQRRALPAAGDLAAGVARRDAASSTGAGVHAGDLAARDALAARRGREVPLGRRALGRPVWRGVDRRRLGAGAVRRRPAVHPRVARGGGVAVPDRVVRPPR